MNENLIELRLQSVASVDLARARTVAPILAVITLILIFCAVTMPDVSDRGSAACAAVLFGLGATCSFRYLRKMQSLRGFETIVDAEGLRVEREGVLEWQIPWSEFGRFVISPRSLADCLYSTWPTMLTIHDRHDRTVGSLTVFEWREIPVDPMWAAAKGRREFRPPALDVDKVCRLHQLLEARTTDQLRPEKVTQVPSRGFALGLLAFGVVGTAGGASLMYAWLTSSIRPEPKIALPGWIFAVGMLLMIIAPIFFLVGAILTAPRQPRTGQTVGRAIDEHCRILFTGQQQQIMEEGVPYRFVDPEEKEWQRLKARKTSSISLAYGFFYFACVAATCFIGEATRGLIFSIVFLVLMAVPVLIYLFATKKPPEYVEDTLVREDQTLHVHHPDGSAETYPIDPTRLPDSSSGVLRLENGTKAYKFEPFRIYASN